MRGGAGGAAIGGAAIGCSCCCRRPQREGLGRLAVQVVIVADPRLLEGVGARAEERVETDDRFILGNSSC